MQPRVLPCKRENLNLSIINQLHNQVFLKQGVNYD